MLYVPTPSSKHLVLWTNRLSLLSLDYFETDAKFHTILSINISICVCRDILTGGI